MGNNEMDEELLEAITDEVAEENTPDPAESLKKHKRNVGSVAVFGLLAACCIGVIGFSVADRYKKAEVPVQNTEVHVGLSDPLSKESIKKSLSEDLIPSYEFLLYGTHNAVDPNNTDKIRTFQFGNNGDYFGYSSAENDDLGTYELYVEDDQIKLKIVCDRVTDRYVVELSDQGELVLNGYKVFVLYEK